MSEIVEDIVREMREIRPDCDDCISNHTCDYLSRFADRIDAAYKRDIQTMVDAEVDDMQTAMDDAKKLCEENERLKKMADIADMLASDKAKRIHELSVENARLQKEVDELNHRICYELSGGIREVQSKLEKAEKALKPVLNTNARSEDVELGEVSELIWAIESAQRIYNEGEA